MTVTLKKINSSFVEIKNYNKEILEAFNEHFTFYSPGYRYNTKYKMNYWDGKIRLFDSKRNLLPFGLVFEAYKIINSITNDVKCDPNIFKKGFEISEEEINKFCELIKLPFEPYPHQIEAIQKSLKRKRITIESATGSGKSLNLFLMCNFLRMKREDEKILILVPTTQLVEQMSKDFQEYAIKHDDYSKQIKKIYSGMDKDLKCLTVSNADHKEGNPFILISTWQSANNKEFRKYFKYFTCVISDECHLSKSGVITDIIQKCTNADYKIGVTGSLSNEKVHEKQLNGLFGPTCNIISAREMINKGMSVEFNVRGIVLDYPVERRIELKRLIDKAKKGKQGKELVKFNIESDFLRENEERLNFISNFSDKINKNTIILFNRIEYGKKIYDELLKKSKKRIYYIDGKTKVDVREKIRANLEKYDDCLLIGSFKCISTGINIKNIHNAVIVDLLKSETTIVQTIGRILRKLDDKKATLYDISDELVYEGFTNYSMKHFKKRKKIYNDQKHNIKQIKVKL